MDELELLRLKAPFVQSKKRRGYLLLASKSGFTEEVLKQDAILIKDD